MRRDKAPGFQPTEAGGGKEKACIGRAPRKDANAGRGGRCCTAFAPVAQLEERRFRSPEVASSNLAGGAFYYFSWATECVNTRKPATNARLRGTDCTDQGDQSISIVRALVKEPAVNTLSLDKQIQVLNCLVEGVSTEEH